MVSTEQTPRRRVNVRGIIAKDGKLLAVKHRSKNPAKEAPSYYCIPGGGLDPHESLENGVKREIMEEMGVEAKIGKLLFIQQFWSRRNGYTEELEFFFAIDNPEDFMTIDLTATSHGVEELAVCEFIDPKTNPVLPAFLTKINVNEYVTSDKPVLILDNFNENK